jgi:hypothetical protein
VFQYLIDSRATGCITQLLRFLPMFLYHSDNVVGNYGGWLRNSFKKSFEWRNRGFDFVHRFGIVPNTRFSFQTTTIVASQTRLTQFPLYKRKIVYAILQWSTATGLDREPQGRHFHCWTLLGAYGAEHSGFCCFASDCCSWTESRACGGWRAGRSATMCWCGRTLMSGMQCELCCYWCHKIAEMRRFLFPERGKWICNQCRIEGTRMLQEEPKYAMRQVEEPKYSVGKGIDVRPPHINNSSNWSSTAQVLQLILT